ncbi:MAG: DNA polymerase III subunit gamma/tau [Treponema sp.]
MDYQITAARRRPQTFEQVLGQEFVTTTLQKSIEAGKIAHAYLFSGPRGCGKTSCARILAKALNCKEGSVPTPCGTCPSCHEITLGTSLDVIEIDGASNTGVNDVRQIKDEILFPPNVSRYKIYIIDEVHMLSTSAFNALLKTIEEPPPYVIFIFATTELHKVPATIKSRCQHFNFKLVSIEELKAALTQTVKELQIEADDDALYWIAREATGSVRDCYTLFDQVAAFSDGYITFEKIQKTLGLTGSQAIGTILTACAGKNAQQALLLLDEILQQGVSVEQFIADCTAYLHSALLVQHGITKESLLIQNAGRFPAAMLESWSVQQLERALSLFLQLCKDVRFSINARYELELAVSRLAWLADYVSAQELKVAFDAAQAVLSGVPAPVADTTKKKAQFVPSPVPALTQADSANAVKSTEPSQPQQPPAQQAPVQSSAVSIHELKPKLIEHLQVNHGMLAIALDKTFGWQEDAGTITISVRTPFEAQLLQKERRLLEQTATALCQKQSMVRILLAEAKKVENESTLPAQIEMICRNLKGTVISIQKNAPTMLQPEETE